MQKKIFILLGILLLLLLADCKKAEINPAGNTQIDLQTSLTLRDIDFINDTLGFICGGTPGETGKIWKTTNGGRSWSIVLEVPGRCIYDADFFDHNNGYAGGDALLLLHTTDEGVSWVNVYENDNFSQWSEFIRPIRKVIYPNPRNIIAVGGDLWYKGLMCISQNWGENWFYKDFDNQLNDIAMPCIGSAWICGYGLMLQSHDSCTNVATQEINEDNFTAIDFKNSTTGLACGYNGGIYKTNNAGASWTEVQKSNLTFDNRQHFNDICFISNDRAIAVGNNGLLLFSNDNGDTWQNLNTGTGCDLLSITEKEVGKIWLCGSNGFLSNLQLPTL